METSSAALEIERAIEEGRKATTGTRVDDADGGDNDTNHEHVDGEYEYYYGDVSEEEEEDVDEEDEDVPVIQRIRVVVPGHCNIPELGIATLGKMDKERYAVRDPAELLTSGASAPNLNCLTLDEKITSLGPYFQNGKPTLLLFYVPWSGPCRLAAKEFERKYEEYGGNINFVLVNVDSRGTIMKSAVEISRAFADDNNIENVRHLVLEEDAKMRLALYGVSFFPHFAIVGSTAVRNQLLLNFDHFDWEAVRRLNATTKETIASRSANAMFITKVDLKSLVRYLKYRVREDDIESIATTESRGLGFGLSTRSFLIYDFTNLNHK